MAEEAALTIAVCPQEPAHRGRLLLFERNGRARSFGAIPRETWIDQERTRLAEHFYSIRLGLGKSAGVIDPVVGGEALRRIYGLGALWMHELLGTDIKRTRELTSFMRSLVPDWGSRRGPFRVEVRHSDEGNEIAAAIPFEILPLFDLTVMPALTTKAAMCAAAFRFLGMMGITVRERRLRVPNDFTLRRDPKTGRVPVGAYCDWTLVGVADEIGMFDAPNDDFELANGKVWPSTDLLKSEEEAGRDLARRLFIGGAGVSQPQIHHFACHYGISKRYPLGESFSFTARPPPNEDVGESLYLRWDTLKQELVFLADENGPEDSTKYNPMAVLNACDSAAMRLTDAKPLVWWLLEKGYIAVLGTETQIPDHAASLFSRFMYAHLSEGTSIGEAVRATRWDMLEKLNNPVGLFFTLHGRPEVHLEPRAVGAALSRPTTGNGEHP